MVGSTLQGVRVDVDAVRLNKGYFVLFVTRWVQVRRNGNEEVPIYTQYCKTKPQSSAFGLRVYVRWGLFIYAV